MVIAEPAPLELLPTETVIAPAVVEPAPVTKVSEPEDPEDDVPVLTVTVPVLAEVDVALRRETAPEVPPLPPSPLAMSTVPPTPEAEDAAPAVKETPPPTDVP
jgi:hypothetical protein